MKFDRNCTIDKTLVFKQNMVKYMKDRGLQPIQRFGDQVVQDSQAQSLVRFVQKHMDNQHLNNNSSDPRQASKLVRDVLEISRGTYKPTPKNSVSGRNSSRTHNLTI